MQKVIYRCATLNIKYILDDEMDKDLILKSAAARSLFSRGPNYAITPNVNSIKKILEDIDRLEYRMLGSVMKKTLERSEPSKLRKQENDLGLQHFKTPAPFNITILRALSLPTHTGHYISQTGFAFTVITRR